MTQTPRQPKLDHLEPGDFVWFCSHCGWQGARNVNYMRPTHACPFVPKGWLTDDVSKVVKSEAHALERKNVDLRGDRTARSGDPVGLNRLRRARVEAAEAIANSGGPPPDPNRPKDRD